MERIGINDLDYGLTYEGYYWYSNKPRPELVKNEVISKDIFKELPFIVEGNLYSKESGVSISIKFIDGDYHVFRARLNNLPERQMTVNQYLTHNLNGVAKLEMIQFWEESKEDPLLENMKTLIPTWRAFAGFIKK